METVNNTELGRCIKAYLSEHRHERPFVIAGKPGTGRLSIFSRTLDSIGIRRVPFNTAMKLQCGGEHMVPFVCCVDDTQFFFDYRLACDFVKRTGRPVVIITDEAWLDAEDERFRTDAVRYVLSFHDFCLWGYGNIGAPGHEQPRMNTKLMTFLNLHTEWYEDERIALSPKMWKRISDRWNHLDRIPWLDGLEGDGKRPVYLAAMTEFTSGDSMLLLEVDEYLKIAL